MQAANHTSKKFGLFIIGVWMLACSAHAQSPTLHLQADGVLTWTNQTTNAAFTLEWAPQLPGAWRVWDSCIQQPVTSAVTRVEVPLFFRIALNTNISKFVPPAGQTLVMIGQDTNAIDRYVEAQGLPPGGVMLYTSIQNVEGLASRVSLGGGPQYGQYLVDRYAHSAVQIGLYMVGALGGVLSGAYDSNIDALGQWIASAHRPVYLRIGYEFDADWTGYDPAQYAAAYRYLVDRFRSNGVDNAAYVWHSYAAPARAPLMAWYPGDAYVDWVAASLFAGPLTGNRSNLTAVADLARALHKPFMLAEASPHGLGVVNGTQSWGQWFDPVFTFIRDYDVRAFCYINCNWDDPEMWQFNTLGWNDARIQTNAIVQSLWLQKMAATNFLHASTNLFRILGYDS